MVLGEGMKIENPTSDHGHQRAETPGEILAKLTPTSSSLGESFHGLRKTAVKIVNGFKNIVTPLKSEGENTSVPEQMEEGVREDCSEL